MKAEKTDWRRKLTSRKLWVAVAGLAAGLITLGKGSQDAADKTSGTILSGAAVIGYIFGEGLTDAASCRASEKDGDKND